jgi:hypothetical protein
VKAWAEIILGTVSAIREARVDSMVSFCPLSDYLDTTEHKYLNNEMQYFSTNWRK